MGNIISTHIALFPKLDENLEHQSIAEITTSLLKNYFGNTYRSSPFLFSAQDNWMYDISFCSKWEPSGIFELFLENSHLYDKAFVRFHDDMGDHDRIFSLPSADKADTIKNAPDCLYLFDQIVFSAFDGYKKLIPHVEPAWSGLVKTNLGGTMYSKSEIPYDLLNGINSNILETPERISTYPMPEMTCENPEALASILTNSNDIFFLYKQCTVERTLSVANIRGPVTDNVRNNIYWANQKKEMVKYFSCGWLNCGNEEFVKYVGQRKVEYGEYIERVRKERGY